MIFSEAQTALARRLDIDLTDISNNQLFTLDDIKAYINAGAKQAWDMFAWDFADGDKTTTVTSQVLTDGYIDYPTDITQGSVYMLLVNGVEWQKLTFQDFKKYKGLYPNGVEKLFSERKGYIFLNTNALSVSDTIDVFGKIRSATLVNDSDLMPFSPVSDNLEDSGNDAVILLAYSEALGSQKMQQPAESQRIRAEGVDKLNRVWLPMAKQRSLLQSKDRPLFIVPDFFPSQGSSFLAGNFQ